MYSFNLLANKKIVEITDVSQLPPAVGGFHDLENNATYIFKGLINIGTNQIRLGVSNTLLGYDKSDHGISYSGTGAAIVGTNRTATIRQMLFSTPNGSVINITNSTTFSVQLQDNIFMSGEIGTINGSNIVAINGNILSSLMNGNPFNLIGTINEIGIANNYFLNFSKNHLNFDTLLVNSIIVNANVFKNNLGFYGLRFNAVTFSIPTSEAVSITGNSFFGTSTTYVVGANSASLNYVFAGNIGVLDTLKRGEIRMQANTTPTITALTTNYYKAEGATTALLLSQFDMPANNRLRYLGLKPITIPVTVVGSIFVASNDRTVRLVLNFFDATTSTNTLLLNSEQETRCRVVNESENFAIRTNVTFKINDYVELFVRNISNNSNTTVEFFNFLV